MERGRIAARSPAPAPAGSPVHGPAKSPVHGPALSVCMIVKNEASHIEDALRDFQSFADEIVVVDTGSTDETLSIVRRYTDAVFHFDWRDDFSAARNFSIEKARGRYIAWFDADDRMDPEMQQRVIRLKSYFDGETAFYFLLHDTNAQGQPEFCHQLRCAPRLDAVRFRGRIHEQLYQSVGECGLKTAITDITVRHIGYRDARVLLGKERRNLAIMEKEIAEGRDDEQIHFSMAIIHRNLGNIDGALASMEKALVHLERQVPRTPEGYAAADLRPCVEAYLFLASLHAQRGERQQALRYLARADVMTRDDAYSHVRIASRLQDLQQHFPAVESFKRALHGKVSFGFHPSGPMPERREILFSMALSLLCMNRRAEALEVLAEAGKSGPAAHELWERVGFRMLGWRRWELAREAFETALALGTHAMGIGGDAMKPHATGVHAMGPHATASHASGVLSADGYCSLALIYAKDGDAAGALACYEAVLAKTPDHGNALSGSGYLLMELGRWREAGNRFGRLIDAGVRDVDIVLAFALAAARDGDRGRVGAARRVLAGSGDASKIRGAGEGSPRAHSHSNPTDSNAIPGSFKSDSSDEGPHSDAEEIRFFREAARKLRDAGKVREAGWARSVADYLSASQTQHP